MLGHSVVAADGTAHRSRQVPESSARSITVHRLATKVLGRCGGERGVLIGNGWIVGTPGDVAEPAAAAVAAAAVAVAAVAVVALALSPLLDEAVWDASVPPPSSELSQDVRNSIKASTATPTRRWAKLRRTG